MNSRALSKKKKLALLKQGVKVLEPALKEEAALIPLTKAGKKKLSKKAAESVVSMIPVDKLKKYGLLAGGALIGVLMNFFMTFMAIGPCPEFAGAYFHALGFSILVSAISSCVWVWMVNRVVGRVYGSEQTE